MSTQQSVNFLAPKRPRGRPKKQVTVTQTALPTAAAPSLTQVTSKIPVKNVAQVSSSITQSLQATSSTTSTLNGFIPQLQPAILTEFTSTPLNSHTTTPFTIPTLTATTSTPPNWLENCEDTTLSLLTFKEVPISPTSSEYITIKNMLHPIQITRVQQVVNPDLWKRFVLTRKEMLRSKTDDLNILSKLGMDENELMRSAHFALNFTRDPMLLPYSDNMVLLFHCTRSKSNLEKILAQGLDERLNHSGGGLLGKGIYFSDDPIKSLQYDGSGHILIFAVLLGDCISVDSWNNKHLMVREPEKTLRQKRNINDQFFDSIVARPGGFNEYVIYNRYQCCPLYQVTYKRATQTSLVTKLQYPPIAWIPQVSTNSCAMPVPVENALEWPFFAVHLFEKIGALPPKDENTDISVDDKLATLIEFGFLDENRNREILSKFDNDLDKALNYVLSLDNSLSVVAENQPILATISNAPTEAPTRKEKPKLESVVTIDLCDDSD